MVHKNAKSVAKLYGMDKKYCASNDTLSVGQTNFRSEAPQQHKESQIIWTTK